MVSGTGVARVKLGAALADWDDVVAGVRAVVAAEVADVADGKEPGDEPHPASAGDAVWSAHSHRL